VKIVAVSQRIDDYPDRNERRDALDQKLSCFLMECGFVSLPVPNGLSKKREGSEGAFNGLGSWLQIFKPNAILLSGGNDVGACLDRDSTERALIDFASKRSLPVLGICRGMQMMATLAGSSLRKVTGHVCTRHLLQGGIISGEVNSYHDMSVDSCPSGYKVLATSEDGEIEAIRHEEFPLEGWMWHPEREKSFELRDIQRVRNLFSDR
jgi:GMP synthase-like glutamine amidotransferase